MIICILCTNEKVSQARESAKKIDGFENHTSLAIPLSENGEAPATHWFCSFDVLPETYQKILELQEFTEVIESNPKEFLESRNLKKIPLKKMVAARREHKGR